MTYRRSHQKFTLKSGWVGVGDWLGTNRRRVVEHRPYKEARKFMHTLNMKSFDEWRDYLAKGKVPHDIPSSPASVYAKKGWSGWGDWLGTATQHSGTRAQADGVGITR